MRLGARAFTLIELTLVTVIILALVGLSIPLFKKTFSDLSAKDTAFTVSKLASYAQEKAIIDKKNYKVIFDFNQRSYQLFESVQLTEGLSYKKAQGRFGRVFTLPQGLFFYNPKDGMIQKTSEEYKKQAVFYPDGHCDELSIDVVNKTGSGYGITTEWFGSLAGIKAVNHEE
jgi:Tfp pilus assembly protein FimT